MCKSTAPFLAPFLFDWEIVQLGNWEIDFSSGIQYRKGASTLREKEVAI